MIRRGLFAMVVAVALALAPAAVPARAWAYEAAAEYNAAVQALRYGDYDGAIRHATFAIRLNPAFAHAYGVRSMAFQQRGQLDLAIADSTKDLVFDPNDAIAFNNRGSQYAARGDHSLAIADYNVAIALKPDFAEAYMGRGSEYGQMGSFDRSIADLERAVALRPGYAEAHQNLGVSLDRAGQRDRAQAEYRAALALRPDLPQPRNALMQAQTGTFSGAFPNGGTIRVADTPPLAAAPPPQPALGYPPASSLQPRDPVVISVAPMPKPATPVVPIANEPPLPSAAPVPHVSVTPLADGRLTVASAAMPPPAAISRFPETPLAVSFAAGPDRPHDVAVIIGNANYGKFGKDIPDDLPAYADAEGIRLYARQALGIHDENIIFLRDATGAQMETVFGNDHDWRGKLFDYVKPGTSRVFVYFAGHGAPGATREASPYLVPSDADPASIALSGYSLARLYDNLGKLPAESVTVVLESCFSGNSPGGELIGKASPIRLVPATAPVPRNLTVIAASSGDQMANWERDNSDGLFTKYFLLGMSGAAAKPPYGKGDGHVTLDGLAHYLNETMTYYARRYYGRDQVVHIVKAAGA